MQKIIILFISHNIIFISKTAIQSVVSVLRIPIKAENNDLRCMWLHFTSAGWTDGYQLLWLDIYSSLANWSGLLYLFFHHLPLLSFNFFGFAKISHHILLNNINSNVAFHNIPFFLIWLQSHYGLYLYSLPLLYIFELAKYYLFIFFGLWNRCGLINNSCAWRSAWQNKYGLWIAE